MSKRTAATPLMATSLTVEGSAQCLTAPAAPVFGWLLDAGTSASAGQMVQTAYRLRVLDHTGKDVWDSGTVVTGQQHHRPYTGPDLTPDSDYQWTVQLTDATALRVYPASRVLQYGSRQHRPAWRSRLERRVDSPGSRRTGATGAGGRPPARERLAVSSVAGCSQRQHGDHRAVPPAPWDCRDTPSQRRAWIRGALGDQTEPVSTPSPRP